MSDKDYEEQKKIVNGQKANDSPVNPSDVYKLAQLMARWKNNDHLTVCLLCQDVSKSPKSLGHLIPHSILKEAGQKYFADLNQGKECGSKKMGYYAFCPDCESRFQKGENHLNPKFYKTFCRNETEAIKVNVVDEANGFPWLYYSFVSIVWRCMCFIPMPSVHDFINVLEVLRTYLLNPMETEARKVIDSSVKLFVFAPNSEVDKKLAEGLSSGEDHRVMFYGTFHAQFWSLGQEHFGWVLLGPVHILLVYSDDKKFCSADFCLGQEDWKKALDDCELKAITTTFVVARKEDRFFPMIEMYDMIVELERHAIVSTATIKRTVNSTESGSSSFVLSADHLYMLPSGVTYDADNDHFQFSSKIYKVMGAFCCCGTYTFVLAQRGKNQRVAFVAEKQDQLTFAVGLTLDDKNEVNYMNDVYIPPPGNIGEDLRQLRPRFKTAVEGIIKEYLKREREQMKHAKS